MVINRIEKLVNAALLRLRKIKNVTKKKRIIKKIKIVHPMAAIH